MLTFWRYHTYDLTGRSRPLLEILESSGRTASGEHYG